MLILCVWMSVVLAKFVYVNIVCWMSVALAKFVYVNVVCFNFGCFS